MKLKLKLSKRQLAIAGVAALVVLAVLVSRGARDSSADNRLDDAANQACSDFADGYPSARSQTARLALADKVNASSARTENDSIARRAAEMGRSANDDDAGWKTASDALTAACQSAGWPT